MRVLTSRVLTVVTGLALVLAGLAASCTDQTVDRPGSGDDLAPDSGSSTSRDGGGSSATDGATDAGPEEEVDAACVYTSLPPVVDGGGRCGAMKLGTATSFGPVDASDSDYDGGTIPPGIYDAIIAERLSATPGSWNETFVVGPGNRFTRVRQLNTGGSTGALYERSGTFTTSGNQITFTYDCAYSADAAVDAGPDTLPYEIVGACNASVYRYGVTGIRVTLKRR